MLKSGWAVTYPHFFVLTKEIMLGFQLDTPPPPNHGGYPQVTITTLRQRQQNGDCYIIQFFSFFSKVINFFFWFSFRLYHNDAATTAMSRRAKSTLFFSSFSTFRFRLYYNNHKIAGQ
jgi:hypothetical protein